MNEWSERWNDGSTPVDGARVMPHVQRRPGGYGGYDGYGQPPRSSQGEPPLPPELSPRRAAAPRGGAAPRGMGDGSGTTYRAGLGSGGPSGPRGAGSKLPQPKNWRRRIGWTALTLVVVLVVTTVATYFWADSKLTRTIDLSALPNRPALGKGTNYLIAGSDNRSNLTSQQQQQLHTGSDNEGQYGNSDTMMILHIGSNGDTLLSLPRDSYVTIPAFTGTSGAHYPATKHKLNVAFSWGGGQLLAQTVEYNTGIHIDHYAEIGFGGFVNLVNTLGGVTMCLDKPLVDQASGANFQAGCQTFNGAQALSFVRERHQEANQDLGREKHQQQFLQAIAHQTETPGVLLNPFTLYPALGAGLETLNVDKDMSLYDLAQMMMAMKDVSSSNGNSKSMIVPVGNPNYSTKTDGDALLWDKIKAQQLFSELQNDQPVAVSDN
ncbi:MAG: LCP family protein [Streptomycetaceae bacterium]|nr:LCP family protein [Streptomycetaceae bacterium]